MIPKRSAVFVILVLTSLYYIYFLQSFFSPSPPITTTTIATPSNPSNQTTSNPTFSPTNLALTHSECLTHFPSLFTPLDKTASFFTKNPPLTRTYFDSLFTLRHSPHQNDAFQLLAALKNGSLYIKEYRSHHGNAARAKLLLDQLYQPSSSLRTRCLTLNSP
ncbi:hypothetical protein BCR33DRAFT_846706 [Rhizoclosmatium globosum]|uniref:Uncharacterized protein n=1 Tax=Rhizoclosmatium globosum TaxID=329046 RepID=A0A1Y2CW73_9FUNG|nr:hypothetical protein BCR33DRAFT_846706 [Rhizoclosmatium globosum]|eukprot:ORY51074.1 hypothetical protein BCR33DRAFT_846706 [Rhizoclosmatium globosum]